MGEKPLVPVGAAHKSAQMTLYGRAAPLQVISIKHFGSFSDIQLTTGFRFWNQKRQLYQFSDRKLQRRLLSFSGAGNRNMEDSGSGPCHARNGTR